MTVRPPPPHDLRLATAAVAAAHTHVATALHALCAAHPPTANQPPAPVIVLAARRRLDDVANTLAAALGLLEAYERTRPRP